jgi:hypothetical protein
MAVVCDMAPCRLVEVDRRFRGAFYLYHQDEMSITDRPNGGVTKHL